MVKVNRKTLKIKGGFNALNARIAGIKEQFEEGLQLKTISPLLGNIKFAPHLKSDNTVQLIELLKKEGFEMSGAN